MDDGGADAGVVHQLLGRCAVGASGHQVAVSLLGHGADVCPVGLVLAVVDMGRGGLDSLHGHHQCLQLHGRHQWHHGWLFVGHLDSLSVCQSHEGAVCGGELHWYVALCRDCVLLLQLPEAGQVLCRRCGFGEHCLRAAVSVGQAGGGDARPQLAGAAGCVWSG